MSMTIITLSEEMCFSVFSRLNFEPSIIFRNIISKDNTPNPLVERFPLCPINVIHSFGRLYCRHDEIQTDSRKNNFQVDSPNNNVILLFIGSRHDFDVAKIVF